MGPPSTPPLPSFPAPRPRLIRCRLGRDCLGRWELLGFQAEEQEAGNTGLIGLDLLQCEEGAKGESVSVSWQADRDVKLQTFRSLVDSSLALPRDHLLQKAT